MTYQNQLAVLAVHPTSRGFGWIVFEGPLSPFDWSTAEVLAGSHKDAIVRLEKLLRQYRPDVLVLERFDDSASRRSDRIRQLGAEMLAHADAKGVETTVYSRADIRAAFANNGARTRYEIAKAIAGHLPALGHRLPPPKKIWEGEQTSMSLFSAAACALAYYANHSGA